VTTNIEAAIEALPKVSMSRYVTETDEKGKTVEGAVEQMAAVCGCGVVFVPDLVSPHSHFRHCMGFMAARHG
jgi:hypothetical protein